MINGVFRQYRELRQIFLQRVSSRHDRLYIFPTRYGLYFLVIIFVLFLISLSYGHSLAFTTTFIFVSIIVTSSFYTNFNLANIVVRRIQIDNEGREIRLSLINHSKRVKFDIEAQVGEWISLTALSLDPGEEGILQIPLGQIKRGVYGFKSIKLYTTFPFGLFRAWKYWLGESLKFYIYPECNGKRPISWAGQNPKTADRGQIKLEAGIEEFEEHRKYQKGMSWKSVDWKAYSRERGLLTKTYIERAQIQVCFRLSDLKKIGT
jgi:uncharacterized protein (DUF58 family)